MSEIAMGVMPDREGQRMQNEIALQNAKKELAELMNKPNKTWADGMNIGFLHLKIAMLGVATGRVGQMS